ncbi:MAG: zf-TFIIB domain-containing protein [Pseudomonadales bacterium]|nr:zf-TFIIB domain-containing protein [Pseudomonadales bacterium]
MPMQCPKCYGEMETVSSDSTDSLHIDRCHQCQGLYFNQLTRADMGMLSEQVSLDTGDESVGAEYDDMVYVECPKCHGIMDQRMVEAPNRIRFELCPSCYSSFLDAGELRLYLSEGYREEFESLLPEL